MWPPDSSGSWADWVSGIGTLLAVVVALVGIYAERRVRIKAEKRSEAGLFTSWTADVMVLGKFPALAAILSNASQGPVYDVVVMVGTNIDEDQEPQWSWYLVNVPPGKYQILIDTRAVLHTDGVELIFRDSRGQNWRRLSTGQLEVVDRDYLPAWARGKSWPASSLEKYNG